MTRVSPSIAERCRIFSNVTQEENDQNFRRLFYQDGTAQTGSGIPVPVSTLRKESSPLHNGNMTLIPQLAGDLSESSLYRIQRKLRARWETPLNTFRSISNAQHEDSFCNDGEMAAPLPVVHNSFQTYSSLPRLRKPTIDTATMNFSAEEVTTTADETDESKVNNIFDCDILFSNKNLHN